MTIYDANASIGNWPFRAHPTRTAAQLIERLDAAGIDRALVGSLSAVCYRDCHRGTEELLAEIEPYRPRLTPVAVLNPCYAGWERDLAEAHEQHGIVGVRLYPNYHNYPLDGPDGQRVLGAIAERGLLACFVCRHEDRRQRHWLDTPEDLTLAELANGLRRIPVRFLVLEGIGEQASPFATDPFWRDRDFGLEFSRSDVVLRQSVPKAIATMGPERLVFGTGLPLKSPTPALLKLDLLEVEPAAKEAIACGNLMRLTGEES